MLDFQYFIFFFVFFFSVGILLVIYVGTNQLKSIKMKAKVFTTISTDGTKSTYFESAEIFGKHILCHDLNEAINIALYYGYSAKEIKDNTIYFEK